MELPGLFYKQTVQEAFWTAEKWKIDMWCERKKKIRTLFLADCSCCMVWQDGDAIGEQEDMQERTCDTN